MAGIKTMLKALNAPAIKVDFDLSDRLRHLNLTLVTARGWRTGTLRHFEGQTAAEDFADTLRVKSDGHTVIASVSENLWSTHPTFLIWRLTGFRVDSQNHYPVQRFRSGYWHLAVMWDRAVSWTR